jgi:hypothetical protein
MNIHQKDCFFLSKKNEAMNAMISAQTWALNNLGVISLLPHKINYGTISVSYLVRGTGIFPYSPPLFPRLPNLNYGLASLLIVSCKA